MLLGLVLAALTIVTNNATVLYTFYPPLKASPPFYLGLALVVLGAWPITFDLFAAMRAWQRGHPGERTPLPAFMAVVTMLMGVIASLGIVIEVGFQLLPWSLG
jgi:cytochrome c oxidase subunit 1